jgi:hypothetical protein
MVQQETQKPHEEVNSKLQVARWDTHNKELKAKLAELETAQKTKTNVTITALETENNNVKIERQAKLPESASHRCYRRGWLGPCCPRKGAAEWRRRGVDPTGSGGWPTSRLERHRWLSPHLQKPLGPVEISSSKRWRARAPLGVGGRKKEDTGCTQGVTSRVGAISVTPVQQAEVSEPGAGAWCTNTTLEPHLSCSRTSPWIRPWLVSLRYPGLPKVGSRFKFRLHQPTTVGNRCGWKFPLQMHLSASSRNKSQLLRTSRIT